VQCQRDELKKAVQWGAAVIRQSGNKSKIAIGARTPWISTPPCPLNPLWPSPTHHMWRFCLNYFYWFGAKIYVAYFAAPPGMALISLWKIATTWHVSVRWGTGWRGPGKPDGNGGYEGQAPRKTIFLLYSGVIFCIIR